MGSKCNNISHLDSKGNIKMVDISNKKESQRTAITIAIVRMRKQTLNKIKEGEIQKGNVLTTAKIAGIIAAKKTYELIPLCHPIPISNIEIDFVLNDKLSQIEIKVIVSSNSKTGVEMEALVGVSIAAVTIYDMCKSLDPEITITDIMLIKKTGGKSGEYIRRKDETL